MTRKKSGPGLGNSLANDRRKRAEQGYSKASGVPEDKAHRSVLEQTSLDDFIAKAESLGRKLFESFQSLDPCASCLLPSREVGRCSRLAKADFHAMRGRALNGL